MRLPAIAAACVLVAGLSACSGEHAANDAIAESGTPDGAPAPRTTQAANLPATARPIASLPDRGRLVDYARQAPLRDEGYLWHPVAISEAHALRAVATGELTLDAPDGTPLQLKVLRHVEHPDGNWTLIAQGPDRMAGNEAVITFGPTAVFGIVPQRSGPPLHITTRDGRAWMMEGDPSVATRVPKRGPDFVAPPLRADRPATRADAGTTPTTAAAPGAEQAAVTAANTVDVVVGYTAEMAARFNGAAGAVTRITNLIDVTNQAYAASQVEAQLRLAGTTQVGYTNNTDNEDALYALTGVACTPTSNGSLTCDDVPVDASLRPLVDLRTRNRADVAVLVRNYDNPTHQGCGIAWLIGSSQSSITPSDARWGFAVVSDSNGTLSGSAFPSDGYVCRHESFAHEVGHLMGLAHDRTTAGGDDGVLQADEYGTFPYSFGYSTGASGLHTVMAYGASNSTGVRVFSNPNVLCGPAPGVPCGTSNDDNARALRQTASLVARFASGRPGPLFDARRNDVNGDGRTDLTWINDPMTHHAWWSMSGGTMVGAGSVLLETAWAGTWDVLASGDFNGDGRLDLLWTNRTSLRLWTGNGAGYAGSSAGSYPTGWQLEAVGDINGDGRSDLFWRHESGVHAAYWLMSGGSIVGSASFAASPDWRIIGSGDFNGDHRLDVLWTNDSAIVQWQASGAAFAGVAMPAYPVGWKLAAVGDADGDGDSDLVWRNDAATHVVNWLIAANGQLQGASAHAVGPDWNIVAYGDYNADQRLDLAWTNGSAMVMWLGTGSAFAGVATNAYPTGWTAIRR